MREITHNPIALFIICFVAFVGVLWLLYYFFIIKPVKKEQEDENSLSGHDWRDFKNNF